MARYNDTENTIKAIKKRFNIYHEIPCSQDDRRVQEIIGIVIRTIEAQPIADVVPKSEVEARQELYTDSQKKWEKAYEELEIETERLKKSMLPSYYSACTEEEAIKIGKEYGRAEVARKVISDVIEILNDAYRKCDNKEIKTILVIVNAIAELKKKYTEEKE